MGRLKADRLGRAETALRDFALGYPGAYEEFPWGHRAIKVKGKVFVFMGGEDGERGLSVKLPSSGIGALVLPFAAPTGYGLGKSGWISARFQRGDEVPVELLCGWINESYRAIAPKKLVSGLSGATGPGQGVATARETGSKRAPGGRRPPK